MFFKIEDKNIHYKGIVDAEGKAFGHGTATEMHNERGSIWKGTFLNNQPHGLGKQPNNSEHDAV